MWAFDNTRSGRDSHCGNCFAKGVEHTSTSGQRTESSMNTAMSMLTARIPRNTCYVGKRGYLIPDLKLFTACVWLTILSVLNVLPQNVHAFYDFSLYKGPSSNTTGGALCGKYFPKRCLVEATCTKDGICQCPNGTVGDGAFQCYPTFASSAHVYGDLPTLKAFSGTNAVIHYPCRFPLTEFSTNKTSNGDKCHFQIFGSSKILGGRIALTEIEAHLRSIINSTVGNGFGIRVAGKAGNGIFNYTEWVKDFFKPEDPAKSYVSSFWLEDDGSGSGFGAIMDDEDGDGYIDFDDRIDNFWGPSKDLFLENGQKVTRQIDENKFKRIGIEDCGVEIGFRAPNVNAAEQDHHSGLALTINRAADSIHFNKPEIYLYGNINDDILAENAKKDGVNLQIEILDLLLTHPAKQYSTKNGEECEDTSKIYNELCETREKKLRALNTCIFFLKKSQLLSCMDKSDDDQSSYYSLKAFKLCIWNSCSPRQSICNQLTSLVQNRKCSSEAQPELSNSCKSVKTLGQIIAG